MSSRDIPPVKHVRSPSTYKMNKAANMRIQETKRRASANLQAKNMKVSQVRMSRVSVISSKQSVASSKRSLASVSRKRIREDAWERRRPPTAIKKPQARRKKKKKIPDLQTTPEPSTTEERVPNSELEPDVVSPRSDSNEQFMTSNFTYSTLPDQLTEEPTVSAVEIFNNNQEIPPASVTEERGWRIVNYIKSVKNSLFKETGSLALAQAEEKQGPPVSQVPPDSQEPPKPSQALALHRTPKSPDLVQNSSLKDLSPSSLAIKDIKPNQLPKKGGMLRMQAGRENSGLKRTPKPIQTSPKASEKKFGSKRLTEFSNQEFMPKKKVKTNAHIMSLSNVATGSGPRQSAPDLQKYALETQTSPVHSSQKIKKSALKSQSLTSINSSDSESSISPEKKIKRVSILATMSSLDDMASAITQLEREKKLEAIRRLEAVAMEKRKQLADTRTKLRESLEEEIKINIQLESILAKIKMVRKAGEEAASIFDKQTQVFATKKPPQNME